MSETTLSIQPLTAAQRALSIAEIVGLIITRMPRSGRGWGHNLLSCALVNKLWLEDSLSMMWRSIHNDHGPLDVGYENTGLDITFLELDPDRRQFYANFVGCAMLNLLDDTWDGEDPWAEGGELEGLVFPKMTVLHVMLTDVDGLLATGSNTFDEEAVLPSLNCPNLHTMSFGWNDAKLMSNEVSADTWESIFWDLPVISICVIVFTVTNSPSTDKVPQPPTSGDQRPRTRLSQCITTTAKAPPQPAGS